MRHLLSLALLLLGLLQATVCQVSQLEYFIDNDPGHGKGNALTLTAGNDVQQQYTIPLGSATAGYHTLYMRVRDVQGNWSLTAQHVFYLLPPVAASITAAEYFFDTDPGMGNATALPVTNAATLEKEVTIPLDALPLGFHTLYVRVRDNQQRWSLTQQQVFLLQQSTANVNIVSLQYNFSAGTYTSPTYTHSIATPAPAVDLNFTANLSELEPQREYTLSIWAVANTGLTSLVQTKKVKVCAGNVAKAGFDFVAMGTEVSLVDSSTGASKYVWDFGDGQVDSVSNPVHKYQTGGNYNIRQVVSNFCNSDTVRRSVTALSFQSIFPAKGGQNGTVSVTITGGGLTAGTTAKLVRAGTEVPAINLLVKDDGKILQATFELYDKPTGAWDLVLTTAGNTQTIPNAFTVEPKAAQDIQLQIEGRDAIRIGQFQEYRFHLTNPGNIDAKGIPLYIVIEGDSTAGLEYGFEMVKPEDLPMYDSIPTYFTIDSLNGKPAEGIMLPIYVPLIKANGSEIVSIRIKTTKDIRILANTGSAFYNSPVHETVVPCTQAIAQIAITTYNVLSEIAGTANPVTSCLQTIVSKGFDFTHAKLSKAEGFLNNFERYGSMVWAVTSGVAGCATDFIPATRLFKMGARMMKIGYEAAMAVSAVDALYTIYKTADGLKKCPEVFFGRSNMRQQNVRAVTSFDPNEKTGPPGLNEYNYHRGASPFSYVIHFENLATAAAAAQEVIILDTLDKTTFDLGTFALRSFGFGDTLRSYIPGNFTSYANSLIVKRTGKSDLLVRVDAQLDTATGILKWRFLSLDPLTRDWLSDPFDGFLPPNKTGQEGQGFVSYTVHPKTTLDNGTLIKNRALIYFDNNTPIATNEFVNIIDKVSPTSKVSALPSQSTDTNFVIRWSGADAHAGVRSYDIYRSVNNGPFELWLYDIGATELSYTGDKDSLYKFYSIAKDYAGNVEPAKTQAEASIFITGQVTGIPGVQGDGFYFRQNYPNPAHTFTWVDFNLPQSQHIYLALRDMHGKLITQVSNKVLTAGEHKVRIDMAGLSAGMYILELNSKKYKQTIKLVKQ